MLYDDSHNPSSLICKQKDWISKIFACSKLLFLRLVPIFFISKSNTHPGSLFPLLQQEHRRGGEHIWKVETAVGLQSSGLKLLPSGLKLLPTAVLPLSLSFLIDRDRVVYITGDENYY